MRNSGMVAVALVAAALAAGVSSDALAQRNRGGGGGGIVVLNSERLLAESAMGRDLSTKLGEIRRQIEGEAQALQPESQSLEQERQRLAQASRNMSPDQIRNSSTLAPQFQQFQQRLEQYQQRAGGLQGDFDCSRIFALRDFDRVAGPIVQSVMRTRGATIVLPAGGVVHAEPDADITNTVIQQIDQSSRTATVTRHAVSECQAQGAQTTGQ